MNQIYEPMKEHDFSNKLDELSKQVEQFKVELTEEELSSLEELSILQSAMPQKDIMSDVLETIKKAAIDSIDHIIGLDARGDWRPDKGGVVTTLHNFEKGIVATKADQKRFDLWQDRVNETDESAKQFRERVINPGFDKFKRQIYKERRNSDGSYTDGYTGEKIYSYNDPHAYSEPDSSGDMLRDTNLTANADHVNPANQQRISSKNALYGVHRNIKDMIKGEHVTQEMAERSIEKVTNTPDNIVITSEKINKGMKDGDKLEHARKHPELGMKEDLINEAQKKAEKAQNKELFKEAVVEKTTDLAIGIGKSTIATICKQLIGDSLKICVSEMIVEFSNKECKEELSVRFKRTLTNIYERAKKELSHLWEKIKNSAAANALSEIVNLILNYFCTTIKNIFKLIRCLIGSIINAVKILFDSSRPWEERVFEALKLISSGLALATGTLLSEALASLIAKTPLAPIASDISAIIAGLISSILSALVLLMFDRYKANIEYSNIQAQQLMLQINIVGNQISQVATSTIQEQLEIYKTEAFIEEFAQYVNQQSYQIAGSIKSIENINIKTEENIREIEDINSDTENSINLLNDLLS